MRKLISAIFALSILSLLAACGEEEERISTPPTFEGITVEERDPVQDDEQDPYAVPKNGDITLEIQFSNPDNVEFNTVQINGTTYRAHRFSEDSTSENLILDLSAGRIPGETLYEIEEIEYIDEEGVEKIEVKENNAYTLFVMRSTPEATIQDVTHSEATIEFELSIEDSDETLNEARLELVHEEDGVIKEESVESGISTHEFDKLKSDTSYTLRVVATYETDDPGVSSGLVEDEVIGESSEIRTDAKDEPTASITDPSVDETSYTFDLDLSDPSDVLENTLTIKVFHEDDDDEVIKKDVAIDSLDGIHIDELLNNNTYTIEVYGDYNLEDGEGLREDVLLDSTKFSTPEKEIGDISTETLSISENRLELAVDATNFYDSVEVEHMIIKAYDASTDTLLKEGRLTQPNQTFELSDLHADQAIDIEIEASYDLQDDQGYRVDTVHETTLTTPENETPSVTISGVDLIQEGAEVDLSIDNPDDTIIDGSITLYLYEYGRDEPVETLEGVSDTSALIEYPVESDKAYTVEVSLDYDLRDDGSVHEDVLMDSAYTSANLDPKAPSVTINGFTKDQDSIDVDYAIADNDETIVEDGKTLSIDDTSYALSDHESVHTVDSLNSDTDYTVTLEVTYDLGDGEETLTLSETVTTDAKTAPTLEITDTNTLKEGLEYTLDLSDPDSTATFDAVRVLKDESEVATFDEGETLSGLLSETDYTMEVIYTYDLNDGEGEKTLSETFDFTTDAYTAPTVEIENAETTQEGFSFDYTFTDPDGVLDEDSLRFTYDSVDESLTGLTGTIEETGLLSDTDYTATLEGTYDLNDGDGEQTLSASETVTTAARSSATATSGDSSSDPGVSTFDFEIDDPDGTIVDDTLEAELTDESGDTLEEWSLSTNDTTLTHYGLIYDETLTLTVSADIDRHDGEDAETKTLLETTLDVPEYVTYEEDTLDEDAFEGTVDLSELEGVLDFDTLEHSLRYVYSDEVVGEATMSNNELTYNVNGLLADRELELTISGSYDLGDGNESGEIYSKIIRTESNSVPSAEIDIEAFDVGDGRIDFLAPIVDTDEVRLEDSTIAKLYRENSLGEMEYVTEMVLKDDLLNIEDVYEIDEEEREIAVETGTDVESLLDSLDDDDLFVDEDTEILESDRETVKANDAVINNDDYLKVVDQNENVTYYKLLVEHEFYSFEGLDLDYQDYYLIEIETDYYLRDGRGNHEDVNIGNDTVLIDVTPDAPDATISNVELSKGQMTFDASVDDRHETIQDDSLYAVLYKDGNEVERQALDSMDETLTFTELENNTAHSVDIVADVDLKEASIREEDVLATHAFTSYDAAPDVTTTLDSDKGEVTADIDITDPDDTIDMDTLEAVLYDDGTEVGRQALASLSETVTFTELENDTEHTLVIEADVDYGEAAIRTDETLKTDTVSTPDVEAAIGFTTDDVSEHRIDLRIGIDDAYDTIDGSEGVVYVYDEEDNRVTEFEGVSDGNELSLFGLDADSEYTFVFEADTDYLDGQGTTSRILGETTVTTEAYETPTVDVTMDDVTYDDADFTVDLDNPDSLTADITAIKLYQDGTEIDAQDNPDEGSFTWETLDSDTTYDIEVTYEYDKQDGEGTVTSATTETFTTDAYTEPEVSIENVIADEDSVDFTVDEIDPDNRGTVDTIQLLMDDEEEDSIDSPSEGDHAFNDLLSNQEYAIRVTYTYDLDDGEGEQTLTVTESFTTDALTEPTITIEDQSITGDDIEVDTSALEDPDNTVSDMTLELWYNGELQDSTAASGSSTYTFSNVVEPDTEYTIILRADVDLNDTDSPYEDEILDQAKIRNLD